MRFARLALEQFGGVDALVSSAAHLWKKLMEKPGSTSVEIEV